LADKLWSGLTKIAGPTNRLAQSRGLYQRRPQTAAPPLPARTTGANWPEEIIGSGG